MKFPVDGTQRKVRTEFFTVVPASLTTGGAAVSNTTVLPEGFTRATVAATAVGDYTLTYTAPFGRTPVVTFSPLSTTLSLKVVKYSSTTSAVRFQVKNDSGTLTAPTSVDVIVIGSDSTDGVL